MYIEITYGLSIGNSIGNNVRKKFAGGKLCEMNFVQVSHQIYLAT